MMFAVVGVIAGCVCDVFPLSKARFRSSVYTSPDDGKYWPDLQKGCGGITAGL
jgi:hypothetical protein